MQYDDSARNAVIPADNYRARSMDNEDILTQLGCTLDQRRGLNERARMRGMDSVVLYAEEKGLSTLAGLL